MPCLRFGMKNDNYFRNDFYAHNYINDIDMDIKSE